MTVCGPLVAAEPSTRGLSDDKAVAAFYQPNEVQSVYLTVADADLKRMLAALPELVEVPATFRWRDVMVENVSVRFKGNSSSNPKQPHKRSFLIKFDGYDKDRRFFGLRQASFDNGVQFGSLFSEPIITDIDAKYQLIKDDLKTDPFPHRRATVPGDRSYDDIVDSMKAFVRKRYTSAVQQLEKPGERPKVERPPGLPPQLAAKIQLIQKRAEEMQRNGQDVSPIAKVMQRLGPAVQAGKTEEAEKIVAEALKLLGEKDE
jgi:hypothetical protein